MPAADPDTAVGAEARLLSAGAPGGPVAVAVHGMEDTWDSWRPLGHRLAARVPGLRLYALDLPWRTANDYGWRRDGPPGAWLARGLAALPAAPDLLLGHSFGANAVLEVLAAGEQRPAAAVLAAPFFRPPALTVDEELRRRSREGLRAVLTEGLRLRLGLRADRLDEELFDGMTRKMLDRIGPDGFETLFDMFVRTAALPLHRVAVPVLVVAGTDDAGLSPARAAALAGAMPAADVRLRPEYGHFCHVEQAAALADECAAFLRTTALSPAAGRPPGAPAPGAGSAADLYSHLHPADPAAGPLAHAADRPSSSGSPR